MATGGNDSVLDSDSGNGDNSVEIRFVDEDDLPLANFVETNKKTAKRILTTKNKVMKK